MIDVSGLKFRYPGSDADVVKGIDFSVSRGEIFGFLGPSGAGKSTTQKILIKILSGYGGNIKIESNELSSLDSGYFEKIGVAFEFPNLYSKFTAIENLNFFSSLYSAKCTDPQKLLEMLGLEKDGGTFVSAYSKGMKMRLNFLRAIMHNPEILFLDEPTSGLDPANARKMKDIIKMKKGEGKTIFLTTHDMHTAEELCDRVAFIVDGSISLIDSPRNLKIKKGKKAVKVEYVEENILKSDSFPLDDINENKRFQDILKTGSVETIHTMESTLEDIFIETTGRRLL